MTDDKLYYFFSYPHDGDSPASDTVLLPVDHANIDHLSFHSLSWYSYNHCHCVRPFFFSQDIYVMFFRQIRNECGTVITDEDYAEMKRSLSAVNLNAKRQTGNSTAANYDFGIYFNVVASNMTIAGGWVPYVCATPYLSTKKNTFKQTEASR